MIASPIHDTPPSTTLVGQELVARLHDLHAGPAALPAIVALGAGAVPPLEALLLGPSQSLHHSRALAADALAAIGGPAARAALLRALRDCTQRRLEPVALQAEDVVVSHITEHLAAQSPEGPDREALILALIEALRHRPYAACARALGRLAHARAIEPLIDCLYEDTARAAAVQALASLGVAAAPALRTALSAPTYGSHAEAPVHVAGRAAAASLLARLGDWPPLQRSLMDRERAVRVAAALALVKRAGADAPTRAIDVLLAALDETDPALASAVMQVLGGVGAALSESLLELLADATSEGARLRRCRAARLAAQLDMAAAVTPLAGLATSPDAQLRVVALEALAHMPATRERHLAQFLADRELPIARRALQALAARTARARRAAPSFGQVCAWLRHTPMGRSRLKRWWRAAWLLAAPARLQPAMEGRERI